MCLPLYRYFQISESHSKTQQQLDVVLHYTSLSLFFNVMGWSVTMPYLQTRRDELSCDATCYGSITSFRSILEIFGGILIGKISDSPKIGRRACLYMACFANIFGLIIGVSMFSIRGLYYCLIPVALFSNSFSVSKALLSDYHELLEISTDHEKLNREAEIALSNASQHEDQGQIIIDDGMKLESPIDISSQHTTARANSMGKLGMSVGFAVMIGPTFGATFVRSYIESAFLATLLNIISGVIAANMPHERRASDTQLKTQTNTESREYTKSNMSGFLTRPGPLLLMVTRFFMVLAFHIFQTIWVPSLKKRFNFGPKDHGYFMSFVGLSYAFSLGYVAKYIIAMLSTKQQRPKILLVCCVILGFGRCLAFSTERIVDIYIIFFILIVSLGIMNTIMNVDASDLVSSAQVGTLFGILESVESTAGIVGPFFGGVLSLWNPLIAPLTAVVMCYLFVFCLVMWGYERHVLTRTSELKYEKVDEISQCDAGEYSNESLCHSNKRSRRSTVKHLDSL